MTEDFLKLSMDEIECGFHYEPEKEQYRCLSCGETFEEGEIFPAGGRFFEARKAVQIHVAERHGDAFDMLCGMEKKYTGLTENQKELMRLIHSGMSDADIAAETGVSPSTVRHQRFVFREKAKQAKLYLAIYELMSPKANTTDELIDIHGGATMVDDRYEITKSEEDKILRNVFESLEPLRLKVFSPKEKKKIVILKRIAEEFVKGRTYTEKEVNALLSEIYDDYATIRRYLVEYGYMDRTKDGREYRRKE